MRRRLSDHDKPAATKRALLHVSRVLEEVVAHQAAQHGGTVTTIALFEHETYFAHETTRYEKLARFGPVVVGFVGIPTQVPAGITVLPLHPEEPLADEWTVLVLSEHGHAALVATDLGAALEARTLEQGRLFSYEVSTDAGVVAAAAERVVDLAGDRFDAEVEAQLREAIHTLTRTATCPAASVLGQASTAALDRVLHLSARLEDVEREADTDPLTGAANRRAMQRFLARTGARSPHIGVVAFDLDGFKGVNDRYGHAAGDLVLRGFADTVRQHCRPTDVLVRLGGDEFVLLAPGLDLASARTRAQRIVATFAGQRFAAPADEVHARCSAGVGSFPAGAVDLDAVDAALYRAKRAPGSVEAITERLQPA